MVLQGKKALVVGGAVGIGRAVCQAFAAAGASVAVADRGWPDEKSSIVAELAASGVDAYSDEVDVRDEASVSRVIQHAIGRFGRLDILVNNAGITSAGAPMQQQDTALWAEIFAVNVNGVAFGMKHVLPHMLERGSGRIINTSSQLAHKPVPNHGAYCASKAAVTALTASVAQEVARRGITVNCVCPGMTDTAMLYKGGASFVEEKLKALPIGRAGKVSEIAATYVFLASDAAAFFIGQSLSPNGGDVMW
ncbi:SDR family NAD(P)-dependent oxidoreductase [Mesorhizobium sp.]|uniref:SDR family NAD(P)-dependent oxidoreductase n=1 Tax=Mesorhizobium sp. TaxID=1871066 RepID=UPI000FE6AA6E|nr:SDR family NAD(P)-dependent oxidoreductase [Mesorhizobium sp.]RWD98759.1 MAG: SDR family oxidoreductase [Mesorhizobium sp.]